MQDSPGQPFDKQAPEQPRQNLYGREEPRAAGNPTGAIRRQSATRHDDMDMWVVRHRRARRVEDAPPARCVQHAGHTDLGTKVFWICGNGHHRCRRCLEEQPAHRILVLMRDLRDLGGQREDHVEILYGQQILGARRHPVARRGSLARRAGGALSARRAVPPSRQIWLCQIACRSMVAARVIGDVPALTDASMCCRATGWPHSAQAATCPPSTAVRQASMANITLSCARLRGPACAWR